MNFDAITPKALAEWLDYHVNKRWHRMTIRSWPGRKKEFECSCGARLSQHGDEFRKLRPR